MSVRRGYAVPHLVEKGFLLKANRSEILQQIKNSREGFHHLPPPFVPGGGMNLRVRPRVKVNKDYAVFPSLLAAIFRGFSRVTWPFWMHRERRR